MIGMASLPLLRKDIDGEQLVTMGRKVEEKLSQAISLQHLEVVDESDNHNVPAGSESHFKVVMVSPEFIGLKLVARHRMVNAVLKEELAGQIHALAIHTYTVDEWRRRKGEAPMSPPCLGGS